MTSYNPHHLPVDYGLDQYRIVKSIGSGSFGITYKAWDESLHTHVAVKEFFPNGYAYRESSDLSVKAMPGQQDFYLSVLDKFLEEARLLAKFKHPNIVRINRYLEANGTAYLVMDYEEGQTLEEYLNSLDRPLKEDECKQVIIPVLEGLNELHKKSILHRDVKPDNIYIRSNGQPLLLDFGAARQLLQQAESSMTVIVSKGYAAPEQYLGKYDELGPWTDIYGIGATIYRCISKRSPSESVIRQDAATKHQSDPLSFELISFQEDFAYSNKFQTAVQLMLSLSITERPQYASEAIKLLSGDTSEEYLITDDSTVILGASPKRSDEKSLHNDSPSYARHSVTTLGNSNKVFLYVALVAIVSIAIILGMSIFNHSDRDILTSQGDQNNVRSNIHAEDNDNQDSNLISPKLNEASNLIEENTNRTQRRTFQDSLASSGLAPLMIVIESGEFSMGDEYGDPDEKPKLKKVISKQFALSIYEVTNSDFNKFVSETSYVSAKGGDGDKDEPVTGVNISDIDAYLTWLNSKTERQYRLPTETEWEYAARATLTTPFMTGNMITAREAKFNASAPVSVGTYSPNNFGLYDMHGNVWEWTSSCYTEILTIEQDNVGDRVCSHNVLKGGGWNSNASSLRSSNRSKADRNTRSAHVGFRLALDLKSTEVVQ